MQQTAVSDCIETLNMRRCSALIFFYTQCIYMFNLTYFTPRFNQLSKKNLPLLFLTMKHCICNLFSKNRKLYETELTFSAQVPKFSAPSMQLQPIFFILIKTALILNEDQVYYDEWLRY